MLQALVRHGVRKPFAITCTTALGPRALQAAQYLPTAKLGGCKVFGARFGSGQKPRPHQRLQQQQQQRAQWPQRPQAPPPPPPSPPPPHSTPPEMDDDDEQQPRGPSLPKLVIWPFIGLNVVIFLWWQAAQAEAKQADQRAAAPRTPQERAAQAVRGNTTSIDVNDPRTGRLKHMVDNYTISLRNMREGRYWTLATCAVSHATLDHLVFNMVSFNAFAGFALRGGFPLPTFLALALGSGLASDLACLYDWGRKGKETPGLGASGVISGLGTAMACLRPMASFGIVFIPIGIPLAALMAGYIAYDSYRLNSESSNVGHSAHLGGSAFGVLFYMVFLRKYGGVWSMLRRY